MLVPLANDTYKLTKLRNIKTLAEFSPASAISNKNIT